MAYEVKTAVFEGPLDLLLQLITGHQVDITSLSLSDLVSEYVSYLEAMREMDLEVTSEFLLIAATLIQLKARYLLPEDDEIDLDEELALMEERDRLLSRLLACVTFKDVAAVFSHRLAGHARLVPRLIGLEDIQAPVPELELPVDGEGLARLAEGVFAARTLDPDLDHLDLDLPSVADAMSHVRARITEIAEADFDALIAHATRTVEIAAYFLAMLELARWGLIEVAQDHRDAPITIRHRPGAHIGELVSEWE